MTDPARVSNPPPRGGDDWESVALRRVAARVEQPPALPQEAEDFGVLEKLRKRLADAE
jgi:hypothetical protein